MFLFRVLFVIILSLEINAKPNFFDDENYLMHPKHSSGSKIINEQEKDSSFWDEGGISVLRTKLLSQNRNVAKNVIFFLGDGMSLPTITATRAYLGGQETQLPYDNFPYTALSKTYCVDYAVPDSACTATAYLGGVKTNEGTIGVNGYMARSDCEAMTNKTNNVNSIAYYFQANGKKTGLVTTTRVTDASPAGVYAHTSERNWQSDTHVLNDKHDPQICVDIAAQLMYEEIGQNLNVILGGGRSYFLPLSVTDEEGDQGGRTDEVNLINYWLEQKVNQSAEYVWNRTDLLNVKDDTEYLLGLFEGGHCKYNLDRDENLDPSLEEMTEAAIKILTKSNDDGYFLFVEGGRIDHAHHDTKARKSLDESAEFAKAIERAINLTNEHDTLIVVTSDHSHALTYNGYPARGVDVLGLVGDNAGDELPYTILSYGNGPSYNLTINQNGGRVDLSQANFTNKEFQYPAAVPLAQETHAGDDVVVFARGPWSHLFTGVMEQSAIPHLIAYASCVRYEENACTIVSAASGFRQNQALILISFAFYFIIYQLRILNCN